MKKNLFPCASILVCLKATLILSCTSPVNSPALTAPEAPSGVTADAASFCRIMVRWNDNSDNETGFLIQRSTNAAFSAGTVTEISAPAGTKAWSDRNGLIELTTYHYRVLAVNNAGNSAVSAASQATTLDVPDPIPGASRVANHTVINWVRTGELDIGDINAAKANLHIGYGHTSHGSQLTDGMNGLVGFANGAGCDGEYAATHNLFAYEAGNISGTVLDYREGNGLDGDCGYYPAWVNYTRAYLDNPANWQVNVIIWSWCGQAAGYSEEYMEEAYLNPMAQFEADYPDITFVYMTCHLNGTGLIGGLHLRNEQIRAFCAAGNRWLFDFADIESYDPDGLENYNEQHADDACNYDAGGNGHIDFDPDTGALINGDLNWAVEWQNSPLHPVNIDWYVCGAAHSQSLNANMKAYAAWWLWCRLAGWNGN
jgi:hypothetical protein